MWESEKETVLKTARALAEKGLVIGSSGNVSVRTRDGNGKEVMAITPSGRYYDSMVSDDIVIIDFDGVRIEGEYEPSTEKMLHIGIYKARKDVNAVVHSHSIYGSIVSVSGMYIPVVTEDQVECLGGEIKVAGYAPHGSAGLVKNVVSALGKRNAVIMANHGTLSVGTGIEEAFINCEMLEKTAKIFIYASLLGEVNTLSEQYLKSCRT
jgi:L-fuculose-phosphate aldolase